MATSVCSDVIPSVQHALCPSCLFMIGSNHRELIPFLRSDYSASLLPFNEFDCSVDYISGTLPTYSDAHLNSMWKQAFPALQQEVCVVASLPGPRRFAPRHVCSNMRLDALRSVGELTCLKWILSESTSKEVITWIYSESGSLRAHHLSVITSCLCSPPRGRPAPGRNEY